MSRGSRKESAEPTVLKGKKVPVFLSTNKPARHESEVSQTSWVNKRMQLVANLVRAWFNRRTCGDKHRYRN